jgi:pimeloyl-ACP methyl ester carboxylesterase
VTDAEQKVLLVHGLGRTPLSLLLLGRRLRREGYAPEFFGYYAFAESHRRIVERLVRRLRLLAAEGGPVGLVGHSLGGLLLRQALARVPELEVRGLVMLGTPNQPPRLAERVKDWSAFRLFARSCGQLLATPEAFAALPPPKYPYLIIAGTAGWRWTWTPFAGAPNDGFVTVEETRLNAGETPLTLPVSHTFMMNDRAVQDAVLAAFSDAAPGGSGSQR